MLDLANDAFSSIPLLATLVHVGIVIAAALGGLVGFWLLLDHLRCWRLGYRATWLAKSDWVYEELPVGTESKRIQYTREVRSSGYPQPCTIKIDDSEPKKAI